LPASRRRGAGDLWLTLEPPRSLTELLGATPIRHRLVCYDGDTFVAAEPGESGQCFAFVGDDGHGRAAFLHNGRVLRRLA
jgi:hypothetical protein